MPLKAGSSQKVISSNIREFHTGDTYARTKAKFGKAKADKQAIAVAMSTARKYGKKKQRGGGVDMEKMLTIGASRGLQREGMIHSSVPGRTDKLPMNVKACSYVLPADIPSALGQGNSAAGGQILKNMFSGGPYGMPTMKARGRPGYPSMRMSRPRMRQEGGETEEPETQDDSHVPIIAAGGEYIIDPDVVKDIGHGDIKAGHSVLDKFVLKIRKRHIDTLKKLKPPKK